MTSVVSYPNRCSQWGSAKYRGNCDGRLFKNLVLRYIRYSNETHDISNIADYAQFKKMLLFCLKQCYDSLALGGRLAVLIGDVRRKGQYKALIKEICQATGNGMANSKTRR